MFKKASGRSNQNYVHSLGAIHIKKDVKLFVNQSFTKGYFKKQS